MCEIFLINTRPDELDSNNYRFFLEKYKKRMNREKKKKFIYLRTASKSKGLLQK